MMSGGVSVGVINSIAMKVIAGVLILVHASRDDYSRRMAFQRNVKTFQPRTIERRDLVCSSEPSVSFVGALRKLVKKHD